MYHKEIIYDRETRDYAMYLDGELTGFARTYHDAEITLDQRVWELLRHLPAPHPVAATHPEGGCHDHAA